MESSLTKDQVIALYNAIGVAESQLNSVQSAYRLLASTWLLACFAGIGFVIEKTPNLPLELNHICAGIGFVGSLSTVLSGSWTSVCTKGFYR